MSKYEDRAFGILLKEFPNMKRNGLQKCLREIDAGMNGRGEPLVAEDEYDEDGPVYPYFKNQVGFTPDATRLRKEPALFPKCEPFDVTLEIWEIEFQNPLTKERIGMIREFAWDLEDLTNVFSELWVFDKYNNKNLIWNNGHNPSPIDGFPFMCIK